MAITHISSLSELDGILVKNKKKLSVIDFHATWCGPCHAIAPAFEALSKKYTNVNFLKVDVDAAQDVAQKYQVSAMPTFIFLKGSTKVDQVRGADRAGLETTLKKHSSDANSSTFTGSGQRLGGAPSTGSSGSVDAGIKLDLQMKIFLGLIGVYLLFWYLS